MELNEIWLWYVNEHAAGDAAKHPPVEFSAWDTLARFFDIHPLLTPRYDVIKATPFNASFDEIADNALAQAAISNGFSAWDLLPAGGWRVISERLLYSEIVLGVMAAKEPETIIDRLPTGLTDEQQTKALLLKYLLGHGRSIDRHVLPEQSLKQFPPFPADLPIRRH